MRRFWKQRNEFEQVERELRRARPRPRPEYLDTLAAQVRADRPTSSRRPALRYRVGIAVALTSLLAAAAGAFGGLGYASTASSHTVHAVAQVFSTDRSQGHDSVSQAASHSDRSDSRSEDRSSERENAAGRQYIVFEFVCLHVPPKNPFIFITLRLPKPAADALVARGLATPGPC
jgi:hypothetical protein